jgi:hypothetical protein
VFLIRREVPRSGKNRCGLGLNQNAPLLDGHYFRNGFYGDAIKVPTIYPPRKATAYQIYEFFAQLIFKNNSYFVTNGSDTKVFDTGP